MTAAHQQSQKRLSGSPGAASNGRWSATTPARSDTVGRIVRGASAALLVAGSAPLAPRDAGEYAKKGGAGVEKIVSRRLYIEWNIGREKA